VILIKYNYQTVNVRALYESTDGPAEQPADNPGNSAGLGEVTQTISELRVLVY